MQSAHQPDPTLLADGLYYRKETSIEQPEQYLTLSDDKSSTIALSKSQALALFRVILDDLVTVAGSEMQERSNLYEIALLSRFHHSITWLEHWTPGDLAEPELLTEAHEQYQSSYELQEEMLDLINGWQTTLEQEYSKLEEAAEDLDLVLDELGEEEDLDLVLDELGEEEEASEED